jgi:hypothetical protein
MAPIVPGTANRFVAGTLGAAGVVGVAGTLGAVGAGEAGNGTHRRRWHEACVPDRSAT